MIRITGLPTNRPVLETAPGIRGEYVEMARAIIHVGTHKTGTTSLQRWMASDRELIRRRTGIRPYVGRFSTNHYEFPLLCSRPDRDLPVRHRHTDWNSATFYADVRSHIRGQLEMDDDDVLISAEGLSYLRHDDEVEALKDLVAPRVPTFILCVRERAGYLRSYRGQMEKMGFAPSADRGSFAYTADDTWIADFGAIRRTFQEPVTLDYDSAVANWGSVIPAFFEALGIDPEVLPNWQSTWVNRTGG